MRNMMLVKGPENGPPSPELMAAVGRIARDMARAGVLKEMGGLLPSAAGARITASNAALTVIDGPFTESKELIGGFAVLEAASRADAIELGRRFMQLHVDVLGPSFAGELEIRRMADPPTAPEARR